MRRLAAYALNMAAGRFEKFARTTGFMRRGEALSILMDDDRLVARSEAAVWEAVVEWKRDTVGKVGWRGVVGKIRFPLMGEEYLRNRVVGMVGSREDGEWMVDVVAEAGQGGATGGSGVGVEAAGAEGGGGSGGAGSEVGGVQGGRGAAASGAWSRCVGNCGV
jgi:hypothetical protein